MATEIPARVPGPPVSAGRVLRRWKIWLAPGLLGVLVTVVLSLLCMGGTLTPSHSLDRLPIALVNADTGAPLPGQQENLGTRVGAAVVASTPGKQVRWQRVGRAEAQQKPASGKVYGALVIPTDFTASAGGLTTDRATVRPTLTVLTNPGAGSLGSSLAAQISQKAAQQSSLSIGKELTKSASAAGANATTRLFLADPVTVSTRVGIRSANTPVWG